MGLDIRIPIGGMFAALGLLLAAYGLMTSGSEIYARSLGLNVNLQWGLVMLAFGLLMLVLGMRKKTADSPPADAQPPRARSH